MNLFYLEEEEIPKRKVAKKKQNKKNDRKKQEERNDKFSFENEIVIGVTKKEEPKAETKKKVKSKKIENQKRTQAKKGKVEKNQNSSKKQIQKKKNNKKKVIKKEPISLERKENLRKKKRRILSMIKYGTLCVLFIVVILCAMFSPLFNIKEIEVEGNEIITKNEIISLSQIQIEQNTFQLSKNKITKQIKQNAYIENVTIMRKLPSTILLQIEERKPAYLLEYAGSYLYLDKQGYLLEIREEKLELPILQGAITPTSDFMVGNRLWVEDLEKLSTVLKMMELAEANEIDTLITRIDIAEKENFKLIFEMKEKTAYLGDSSNLNTKILMIKSILEKEEGKAGDILVNMDLNKENPVFRERV